MIPKPQISHTRVKSGGLIGVHFAEIGDVFGRVSARDKHVDVVDGLEFRAIERASAAHLRSRGRGSVTRVQRTGAHDDGPRHGCFRPQLLILALKNTVSRTPGSHVSVHFKLPSVSVEGRIIGMTLRTTHFIFAGESGKAKGLADSVRTDGTQAP